MSKKLTTKQFISNAIKKHGDKYNYSKSKYVDWKTSLIIICPIKEHGEFNQRPNNHTNGQGCPICANQQRPLSYKSTIKNKNNFTYDIKEDGVLPIQIISVNKDNYTIVDVEDVIRISEYNWNISSGKYANNNLVGLLHRFIMNVTDSNIYVDHKNHNTLDNRKQNLRLCSPQENSFNQTIQNRNSKSSKYKGVFWDKGRNKWQTSIKYNQKRIYIGRYENEEEAAKAYDLVALNLFGEFSNLNFKDNKHDKI